MQYHFFQKYALSVLHMLSKRYVMPKYTCTHTNTHTHQPSQVMSLTMFTGNFLIFANKLSVLTKTKKISKKLWIIIIILDGFFSLCDLRINCTSHIIAFVLQIHAVFSWLLRYILVSHSKAFNIISFAVCSNYPTIGYISVG